MRLASKNHFTNNIPVLQTKTIAKITVLFDQPLNHIDSIKFFLPRWKLVLAAISPWMSLFNSCTVPAPPEEKKHHNILKHVPDSLAQERTNIQMPFSKIFLWPSSLCILSFLSEFLRLNAVHQCQFGYKSTKNRHKTTIKKRSSNNDARCKFGRWYTRMY